MKNEPLFEYLFEIIEKPESEGIILTGGLGMRLKHAHIINSKISTLVENVPQPRPTTDLDLFLRVQFWIEIERAIQIRALVEKLGYQPILHSWHFRKPIDGLEGRFIKLDFQARTPLPDESVKVKQKGRFKQRQVGRDMGSGLAGLETIEAFSLDEMPIPLSLTLNGSEAVCLVPHPYTWLNLKIAAAFDWLLEQRGEIPPKFAEEGEDSKRLKHVFDVVILVAMLTVQELSECKTLATKYLEHPLAAKNRESAKKLFEKEDGEGMVAARYYAATTAVEFPLDHDLFWTTLQQTLGM